MKQSLYYKLGVFASTREGEKGNGKYLAGCIMGIVGSSVFGAWPILETKCQDNVASAALILPFFMEEQC